MNISLPDALKSFVDEQVSQRGYGTSSEHVREWIRKGSGSAALARVAVGGRVFRTRNASRRQRF